MDDLTAARRYVRARARWLCGGKVGRGKLDPVYVTTTEGRDQKAFWDHYSSCGDLPQALAYHLGVRTPYVNRKEHTGWQAGRNLLHFYDDYAWPGAATAYPAQYAYARAHGRPAIIGFTDHGYTPLAGDIGFVWTPGQNNSHTFVFGDWLDPEHVETFNYGVGGMVRAEFPGAKCDKSPLSYRNKGLWFGQRKLQFVVPLARLLADATPELLPPMSGDVIDELEARIA